MVLYFTGTGNSRYLARRIAEGLEMPLYDLNACIKAGNTAPVQTGRDVVLVTPNGTPGFHKILPMSEFCSFSMRNESAKTHRTLANKAVPVILRYDI